MGYGKSALISLFAFKRFNALTAQSRGQSVINDLQAALCRGTKLPAGLADTQLFQRAYLVRLDEKQDALVFDPALGLVMVIDESRKRLPTVTDILQPNKHQLKIIQSQLPKGKVPSLPDYFAHDIEVLVVSLDADGRSLSSPGFEDVISWLTRTRPSPEHGGKRHTMLAAELWKPLGVLLIDRLGHKIRKLVPPPISAALESPEYQEFVGAILNRTHSLARNLAIVTRQTATLLVRALQADKFTFVPEGLTDPVAGTILTPHPAHRCLAAFRLNLKTPST